MQSLRHEPPQDERDAVRAGLEALAARRAQLDDTPFPPEDAEIAAEREDVLRDALRAMVMRRQARTTPPAD